MQKRQCLLFRVPAADMEANKLKRYLEKQHIKYVAEERQARHSVLTNTTVSSGLSRAF
jgi:hypothetical protein